MSDGGSRYARRLSRAEAELWTIVTESVRPMRGRARIARSAPEEPPTAASEKKAEPFGREPAEAALAAHGVRPKPAAGPAKPPVGDIDHRTRTKIRRGRLDVDARLDLHGMRQDEAQRALAGFLRRAQRDGARIAIVVTGKGQSREEGGVLRRAVPMWLQAPALREIVVGFGEAARHHGGEGALYVRIRRPERMGR
jgi:DNA-nicking Smr family endonuclease